MKRGKNMKKIIPFVIIILIVVIGIVIYFAFNNAKHSNEVEENLGKAQLVEIYDYHTNELLKTYENKEDIEGLMNDLEVDKWEIGSASDEDSKMYIIKMYQEPTKTLLKNENSEMEEVGNIVIYSSGNYADFTTAGMEIPFKTNKNIVNLFE